MQDSNMIRKSEILKPAVFAWATATTGSTISMSLGSKKCYDFNADASGPAPGSIALPKVVGNNGIKPMVAVTQKNQTA
jgi:hypothetical protein